MTKVNKALLLLAIAVCSYFLWEELQSDPFLGATAGTIHSTPNQTDASINTFQLNDFNFLSHSYEIAPIAKYDISGRILHKRRYFSDKYKAGLVPYDLAIGWGHMSNANLLSHNFEFDHKADTYGGRYLWLQFKVDKSGYPVPLPKGIKRIGNLFSNNHIIPANKKIYRQLANVKAGDLVRLKGYLVNIRDKSNPGWTWKTSLTRTDTSTNWGLDNTSCETIYVLSIDRITSTSPLTSEPMPEWFWPI